MARKSSENQNDGRSLAVQGAIDQIKEKFGDGSIMRLGEARKMQVEAIPTGCLSLDLALGVFGVPRGRIVEVFGPEASGKTTLAMHIVAEAQKLGGVAAFVDAEHALDPDYARKVGVKVDQLLISQPDNGEQALDIVETLVRSNAVDVVVVDSVAALTPRAEIEGEMGDSMMGVQARLMSQALRKLTGVIARTRTVCIFTNQLRQKIGVMFGNPETTPGGLAMKFYASIRLDVRKIEVIKDKENVIGSRHRVKVVKNKVASPFRVAEFEVLASGISKMGSLLDIGMEMGFVNRSGAFYKYGDQMLGQGRQAAIQTLEETPAIAEEIHKKIWDKVKNTEQGLPKEFGEEVSDEEAEQSGVEEA